MSNKTLYTYCTFILLISNAWSLTLLRSLQKELSRLPPGINLSNLSQLKTLSISDKSGALASIGSNNRLTLLYLFGPSDCPTAVEELGEIEQLHHDEPLLDIKGIATNENSEEAAQTKADFHLDFPIIPDPHGSVLALLQPPQTPWKVIFGPNGQVLMEDGPSILPEEKIAFRHRAALLDQGLLLSQQKTSIR